MSKVRFFFFSSFLSLELKNELSYHVSSRIPRNVSCRVERSEERSSLRNEHARCVHSNSLRECLSLDFLGRWRLYAGTYLTTRREQTAAPGRNKLECLRWIFLPFVSFPLFACPMTRERGFLSTGRILIAARRTTDSSLANETSRGMIRIFRFYRASCSTKRWSFRSLREFHTFVRLFNCRNRRRFGSVRFAFGGLNFVRSVYHFW